ncbi:MAG: rhodanese-like domain-containing protein [Gammaproteobacteria bacterium]
MIEMTAVQLHQHLAESDLKPLLLDVREQWEFDLCHIEESILIPMSEIVHKYDELDTQQETVIICHHGIRSRQIGLFLEAQKFSRIINLSGGVAAWAESVDPGMPRY